MRKVTCYWVGFVGHTLVWIDSRFPWVHLRIGRKVKDNERS